MTGADTSCSADVYMQTLIWGRGRCARDVVRGWRDMRRRREWEVGCLSWRGRFVAVTEVVFGCGCMEVGRWSVTVEDDRNEKRASVAVRGDEGFLVRQAGMAGGSRRRDR